VQHILIRRGLRGPQRACAAGEVTVQRPDNAAGRPSQHARVLAREFRPGLRSHDRAWAQAVAGTKTKWFTHTKQPWTGPGSSCCSSHAGWLAPPALSVREHGSCLGDGFPRLHHLLHFPAGIMLVLLLRAEPDATHRVWRQLPVGALQGGPAGAACGAACQGACRPSRARARQPAAPAAHRAAGHAGAGLTM